jgi:hypothetical protein
MSGLSDEASVRLSIIIADACRTTRLQLRLSGKPEPDWVAELARYAGDLRDDVMQVERRRKRALNREAARRYRARLRNGAA